MIQKWFGIPALLLLSVLLIAFSSTFTEDDQMELVRAFERMDVEATRYMVHHGGRIDRRLTGEEVRQLADGLADELSLGDAQIERRSDGTRLEAAGTWSRNIQVELTVINDRPQPQRVQPYLAIRVSGSELHRSQLLQVRNRLHRALHQYRIQPRTHFSIQGTVSMERADRHGREALIRRVMKALGAREVESMRTDRTTSVSAYTPLFTGGLKTGGGIMNVQIAAKAGQEDRQMILTLGTPIITIEY